MSFSILMPIIRASEPPSTKSRPRPLETKRCLVFGAFLRPLRVLTDVLNVRHALRAADGERPLAHGIFSDPRLLGIAHRQLARMREEGLIVFSRLNSRSPGAAGQPQSI